MFKVICESEYNKPELGEFSTLEEAMKVMKIAEGFISMLESINHAEIPDYRPIAKTKDAVYFPDGTKSKLYPWD